MLTFVAAILVTGSFLGSVQSINAASGFRDVPADHWAKPAIEAAVRKGYFKGYSDGSFQPNATVTRAEFAALLARVSTNPWVDGYGTFADLKGHWSEQEVNKAISMGLISSSEFSDGFKPNSALLRREMAKWMVSGLASYDEDYQTALTETKDTLVPVVEYYKGGLNKSDYPYVSVALGTGFMNGFTDGTFGPGKTITRAEVAVILLRYELIQEKSASSFKGLNELREVGMTGTNLKTVIPTHQYTEGHELKTILGKDTILRNGIGKVQLHHFIFIDGSSATQTGSIYGRMFVDKDTTFLDTRYRLYIDSSVIPTSNNFSPSSYINGLSSSLQGGHRIQGVGPQKFEYKILPDDGEMNFFAWGNETRFWSSSSIARYAEIGDVSALDTISADDGSYATIYTTERK